MASTLTLVADVGDAPAGLVPLVRAVDAQSMPYSAFDVVLVVPPHGPVTERVRELATRRPNVRLAQSKRQALAESSGDLVVTLDADGFADGARLLPDALARLSDFARRHDCDVVVARVDHAAGLVVNDALLEDAPRRAGHPAQLLISSALVAYRRSILPDDGIPADVEAAGALLARTDKVGSLGVRPCLVLAGEPVVTAAAAPQIAEASAAWRGQELVIDLRGSCDPGRQLAASLHNAAGRSHPLPVQCSMGPDGAWTATVEIDLRTVADGVPAPAGVWQVHLGAHGAGDGWTRRGRVPPVSVPPAVLAGLLVAPRDAHKPLALDVGATRTPVVRRLAVADVSITETASGTLLAAQLPAMAVVGDSATPGRLLLGSFELPAVLVAEGGRAELRCRLSGLAGTARLSTRFGSGPPSKTGLSLEISPVGTMRVVPSAGGAARQAAAGRPNQTVASRPLGSKGGAGTSTVSTPTRSLRDRVPTAFVPVVRAAARSPLARRAYRTLAGRRTRG